MTAASLLKIETDIGANEFEEIDLSEDQTLEEQGGILPPPKHVNKEGALVFGLREAKAML